MSAAVPTETIRPAAPGPLERLLELSRRARQAEDLATLRFIAVNDSHLLEPYRQAALWMRDQGVVALSGLTEIEANAPFVQWLTQVCRTLSGVPACVVEASALPAELAAEWGQWFPPHALWVPFGREGEEAGGGLLLVRELPWQERDLRRFAEWADAWFCAWRALDRPTAGSLIRRALRRLPTTWARRPLWWTLILLAAASCPVRLSVLVPGELVPASPVAVRAPLDGVIKAFLVQSNALVQAGQPLFTYDDATLASKLDVALEALRTAEAEQRQFSQQALSDPRARAALAAAKGQVEEKRIDVAFLREQLDRNQVPAPRDGIAFIDDPTEWIGRPVVAGQRIMRIAEPADQEIEAWLPVGDAIVLPPDAPVRLYLSASPLSPVSGQVRMVAYEAVRRPDNTYAYRVRATLARPTEHRVGLKDTARLSGDRVPLIYWMLRRPLAALREAVGI